MDAGSYLVYDELSKQNQSMTSIVTGVVTVTATAAEIFAGSSRLTNRRKMIIKNEHESLRIRIGNLSVTQQNGFPVEPGASFEFTFDPTVDTPVYCISEGASVKVSVIEW